MKALVTGAAGFIGSTLCEHLVGQGAFVTGLDSFTDYYPRAQKEANLARLVGQNAFTFVETSIERANLPALIAGATHVFHLAAQAGVRKSWGQEFRGYTSNNVEATQVLLEACVGQPLQRVIYASSSSVYGDETPIPMREDAVPRPLSPYGVTKLAAEQLCHLYFVNYAVPTIALRYFTVYGPRQRPDMAFRRFLEAARDNRAITLYGDGEQTRDFTFVDDAVTATATAAGKGVSGRAYNIGGGSRVSVNQVLDLVREITGADLRIERQPPQKGDMRDTYADTTLAKQDMNFSPRVGLKEGLAREWAWLTGGTVRR